VTVPAASYPYTSSRKLTVLCRLAQAVM
jgi:hypothetical protein